MHMNQKIEKNKTINFLTILLTNQMCPSYPIGWRKWPPLKSNILHICTADVQYMRIKQKLLCKIGEEKYELQIRTCL